MAADGLALIPITNKSILEFYPAVQIPAKTYDWQDKAVDTAALQAILGGASVNAPTCDVAAWTFMGVSMAGWNAFVSAGLAAFSLAASMRRKESPLRAK